ncbi:uncharacterized protein RJT21DRAFT_123246 [Scheffersomyces amazonensis]|uniref:uncharacterized protein n=1 Tax=Scheffersomyces amazonensis TaxID=1078765 RepID=UPI00315C6A6A
MSDKESLPESVTSLLKTTRFIHLATSFKDVPHVSLMNYTYYHTENNDYIIISTPKDTTKYNNILQNPNVSILIHDWISVKNGSTEAESVSTKRRNSLYELLANLNKNEISRVSVMLDGKANVIDETNESYDFYKSLHLNNSKIDEIQSKNYIESNDNAIILITIKACKVTDTENNIAEY